MNIVVLVKQVPDSGSERKMDPADNTVARAAADNVVNEIDEYAIEEALLVKDGARRRGHRPDRRPRHRHRRDPQGALHGRRQGRARVDEAIHGSDAVQIAPSWPLRWASSSTTWSSAAPRRPTRR